MCGFGGDAEDDTSIALSVWLFLLFHTRNHPGGCPLVRPAVS